METHKGKTDWPIFIVLTIGAFLRLLLGIYNPPNNAFDDYLEPIAFYINNSGRPSPSTCWECYQPPLYFYISEAIYKTAYLISNSFYNSWKCVQLLNTFLSISILWLNYEILKKAFPRDRNVILIVLSVLSIYPSGIYTSAMISNDMLLAFFVTCSILLYITYNSCNNFWVLVMLCISVIAGTYTKQHGLISVLFLASVGVQYLFQNKKNARMALVSPHIFVLILSAFLCLGDEYWKFNNTQKLLVSNQHFFDYASNQLPGSIAKIGFFTFRFPALLQHPHLSPSTVYSYWTVIFASAWFDYEWRFTTLSSPYLRLLAASLYLFGLVVALFISLGLIKIFKALNSIGLMKATLALVAVLYFLVPLVQTLRFPFYSSMKGMFFFPAISIFSLALALGLTYIDALKKVKYTYAIVGAVLILGSAHILHIIYFMPNALPLLSGPLWTFPNLLLP